MHAALDTKTDVGVLGVFLRAILSAPPRHSDHELEAWTLLPLYVEAADAPAELARARALVLTAQRHLVGLLRAHGGQLYARILDDAVERNLLDPSLYGHDAAFHARPAGRVLNTLRLLRPYAHTPLSGIASRAFWAEEAAYVSSYRSPSPTRAATEAAGVFAMSGAGYDRQAAIDAAAEAMHAAVTNT